MFHEFGHLFFHDLARRAALPEASERTMQDFEILRDWLGWDGEKQTEWTREQHEQFARGFEAYLFEGKAPSIELKSVFRRIRDWMVNIYRELRNLNVELSDEVRGVFDRLLATDKAIEEARVGLSIEQDNDFSMLDEGTKAAAEAAREDAYAEAQEELQSYVLREVTKQAQSDWRRAYKRLEPEIRREVASSGVYQHFELMKEAPDLRLSSSEFAERFGEEALAAAFFVRVCGAVRRGGSREAAAGRRLRERDGFGYRGFGYGLFFRGGDGWGFYFGAAFRGGGASAYGGGGRG